MSITVIVMIGLGIWILMLQNRVAYLERIVQQLQDRLPIGGHVPESQESSEIIEPLSRSERIQTAELRQRDDEHERISETSQIVEVHPDKTFPESEPEAEPSWLIRLLSNYFSGGNLLVRIGGVVLFFGLAFLAKYTVEHTTISVGVRLTLIAVTAVGLIGLGWRLRRREGAYGQILQGLGVAILYLVIYAASKFYGLISLESAFVGMLLVVISGTLLASRQTSLPLALFATGGGFLVPILTASGQGNHVVLFGYYVLLNLGIFLIAWKHAWRVLNLTGFLFTFVIATAWGILRYSPDLFGTTEPFLILYFAMYLTITILFVRRSPGHVIDGTLLFGLPAVAFPLQCELVTSMEYGAGISALVMGSVYFVLWRWLRGRGFGVLLEESFLGLGLLFYTIAIPSFLDADITAAVWAVESSAIVWLSLRQHRHWARYFGELLLGIATWLYLVSQSVAVMSVSVYLGYMIVVASLLFAAWHLHHSEALEEWEWSVGTLFFSLGLMVWMVSVSEVANAMPHYRYGHKLLVGWLIGSGALYGIARWKSWLMVRWTLQGVLPVGMILFALATVEGGWPLHPFGGLGGGVFLGLMVWHTWLLYHYDTRWTIRQELHLLSLWFVVAVLTLALRYVVIRGGGSAALLHSVTAIVPVVVVALLSRFALPTKVFSVYTSLYRRVGAGYLLGGLLIWEFLAFAYGSDITAIPYVPILNLLDGMQIVVLYLMYERFRSDGEDVFAREKEEDFQQVSRSALAILSWVLISVIFARAVHHYLDVPYRFASLWGNLYFQTGLSLLWSFAAIVLMLLSRRWTQRILWVIGFGLLGLVVLKLFFVELAQSGTVERIISFIVVGVLLLLIGYFVPMPPGGEDES